MMFSVQLWRDRLVVTAICLGLSVAPFASAVVAFAEDQRPVPDAAGQPDASGPVARRIYLQNFPGRLPPIGPNVFRHRFGHFSTMPASQKHIQIVLKRILAKNELPPNLAVAELLPCEGPNASTHSGYRRIAICRGLLPNIETDDALAFVLSHEVSHILLQHQVAARTTTGTTEKQLRTAVEGAAMTAGFLAGGLPGIALGIAIGATEEGALNTMQQGRLNGFDRQEEADADALGIRIMTQAGYNPSAGVDLIDRVGGMLEPPAKPSVADLRRHPFADYRIASLSQAIERDYRDAADRKTTPLGLTKELQDYDHARRVPWTWASDPSFAQDLAISNIHLGDGKSALHLIEKIPEADRKAANYLTAAHAAKFLLHDQNAAMRYAASFYRVVDPIDDEFHDQTIAASWDLQDMNTFYRVTNEFCAIQARKYINYKCDFRDFFHDKGEAAHAESLERQIARLN